jgi:stage II sporulation protein P
MQTEKEVFELIKQTFPLNPSEDFVHATEEKLRLIARRLDRRRKFKQFSFVSSGMILCAIAISWVFFFSGKEVINNTLSSLSENNASSKVNNQEPLVFIYHTHNIESFIPEIQVNEPKDAFHESKNITLVGERLRQSLKENNINTINDDRDIMGISQERGLNFGKTYVVSRESLKDALENNSTIEMAFDIHRDSRVRNDTTLKINGKDYARIGLIVSSSHSKFEGNKSFAELLHKKMEGKYPGLSRGVIVKSNERNKKQDTYNQELLQQSVLLEIGGIENTLEEEYRTVDAFADVIEEILNIEK